MEIKRVKFLVGCIVIISVFYTQSCWAEDVSVFAEGAYRETDFELDIYADIDGQNIVGFGVKNTYDSDLLVVTSAIKNEDVWFMGDGITNHSYMDPDTTTRGEVIIIGGKLDTSMATGGVGGERVLLAKVFFDRTDTGTPFDDSAITVTYAHGDGTSDFKNFVTVDGTVLDGSGVAFAGVEVHERGDANGDGVITNTDYFAVKYLMDNNLYTVYGDCNADAYITNTDYFCIKSKM